MVPHIPFHPIPHIPAYTPIIPSHPYLVNSKMSPNVVFNRALDKVRDSPEVKRRFGDKLKGYGRDHGGHREGRRNFIEHTEYTDETDGSKRTRVRFNLAGKFGTAFVFAEVSNKMKAGEFVYSESFRASGRRMHNVCVYVCAFGVPNSCCCYITALTD